MAIIVMLGFIFLIWMLDDRLTLIANILENQDRLKAERDAITKKMENCDN